MNQHSTWFRTIRKTLGMLICGILAAFVFAKLSFYIGKFNLENIGPTLRLNERYERLVTGIKNYVTDSPAPAILSRTILFNLVLVNVFRLPCARKLAFLTFWFLLFAVLFISLPPLGGYRVYRTFIIRKDAIQPIIVGIIILYGLTSLHLITALKGIKLLYPALQLLLVSLYFTIKDGPGSGLNHPSVLLSTSLLKPDL